MTKIRFELTPAELAGEYYEIFVAGELVWSQTTTYQVALRRYGQITDSINRCAGPRNVALWEAGELYPIKEEQCGFSGAA